MFENNLVYSVNISDEKVENCIDWLMITLYYIVSISKILIDLCAIRQKIKIKNTFASTV